MVIEITMALPQWVWLSSVSSFATSWDLKAHQGTWGAGIGVRVLCVTMRWNSMKRWFKLHCEQCNPPLHNRRLTWLWKTHVNLTMCPIGVWSYGNKCMVHWMKYLTMHEMMVFEWSFLLTFLQNKLKFFTNAQSANTHLICSSIAFILLHLKVLPNTLSLGLFWFWFHLFGFHLRRVIFLKQKGHYSKAIQ